MSGLIHKVGSTVLGAARVVAEVETQQATRVLTSARAEIVAIDAQLLRHRDQLQRRSASLDAVLDGGEPEALQAARAAVEELHGRRRQLSLQVREALHQRDRYALLAQRNERAGR